MSAMILKIQCYVCYCRFFFKSSKIFFQHNLCYYIYTNKFVMRLLYTLKVDYLISTLSCTCCLHWREPSGVLSCLGECLHAYSITQQSMHLMLCPAAVK